MDKKKCAECGELIFDDMVFVKGIGWVCLDCSIDVEQSDRIKQLDIYVYDR